MLYIKWEIDLGVAQRHHLDSKQIEGMSPDPLKLCMWHVHVQCCQQSQFGSPTQIMGMPTYWWQLELRILGFVNTLSLGRIEACDSSTTDTCHNGPQFRQMSDICMHTVYMSYYYMYWKRVTHKKIQILIYIMKNSMFWHS